MALTDKRYTTVDPQLQEMREALMALAAEIQESTLATEPFCRPYHAAMKAADAVENLRYMLAIAEARRQVRENQERSAPGSACKIGTSSWESVPALKWLTGLLG